LNYLKKCLKLKVVNLEDNTLNKIIYMSIFLILSLLSIHAFALEEQEIVNIQLLKYNTDKAIIIKRLDATETALGNTINKLETQEKLKRHVYFSKDYQLNQLSAETDFERVQLALSALKYYRQFGSIAIIKPVSTKKGYELLSEDPQVHRRQLFFVGDVDLQISLLLKLLDPNAIEESSPQPGTSIINFNIAPPFNSALRIKRVSVIEQS
tara:strand:- start:8276 stop:8905 length:630 start_codon:yes stop_codon:yes gene_type:complete